MNSDFGWSNLNLALVSVIAPSLAIRRGVFRAINVKVKLINTLVNNSLEILIVDANPLDCRQVADLLEESGHQAFIAPEMDSARRFLTEKQIDVAFVSPSSDLNEFSLLKEFEELSPNLCFVIMSGNDEIAIEALRQGALGYIKKPLVKNDFLKEMKRVNGRRIKLVANRLENNSLRKELEGRTRDFLDEVGLNSRLQRSIINSLCRMAEFRHRETGSHIRRMTEYCRELAIGLRTDSEYKEHITDIFLNYLVTTAPLHDIGKAGLPDSILKKPSELTPEEYEVMKTHTLYGRDTLEEIKSCTGAHAHQLINMGQEICLGHHEWWNGQGYPRGISGKDIPLAPRIVALADYYDALSCPRVYRPHALDHETIKKMILEKTGTHFDPAIVQAFLDRENEFCRIREQHQSSGMVLVDEVLPEENRVELKEA